MSYSMAENTTQFLDIRKEKFVPDLEGSRHMTATVLYNIFTDEISSTLLPLIYLSCSLSPPLSFGVTY